VYARFFAHPDRIGRGSPPEAARGQRRNRGDTRMGSVEVTGVPWVWMERLGARAPAMQMPLLLEAMLLDLRSGFALSLLYVLMKIRDPSGSSGKRGWGSEEFLRTWPSRGLGRVMAMMRTISKRGRPMMRPGDAWDEDAVWGLCLDDLFHGSLLSMVLSCRGPVVNVTRVVPTPSSVVADLGDSRHRFRNRLTSRLLSLLR